MKKFLSVVLISSFVLGLVSFLPAMAQETDSGVIMAQNTSVATGTPEGLEKIPTPSMMQMFKNIIKRGTDLFGVRKEIKNEVKEGDISTSTAVKLEKILAPQFISMYERIQKIGNSLWGYKKGGKIPKKSFAVVGSNISACVITSIGVKDVALILNNSNFTSELNTAISARTTCQTTAIGSTENQKKNLDKCIKTFHEGLKQARKKTNDAYKNILKTFNESLKSCKKTQVATTTVSSTESSAKIVIEDGGGNIAEAGASQE